MRDHGFGDLGPFGARRAEESIRRGLDPRGLGQRVTAASGWHEPQCSAGRMPRRVRRVGIVVQRIVLAGGNGDDARRYQERLVLTAVAALREARRRQG